MARSLFGGGIGDQVFGDRQLGSWTAYGEITDEQGDPAAVTLTVWSTRSGGVQLTDLRAANGTTVITAVTTVVGTGQIPEFYGPDGVTTVYLSADGGFTRARFTDASGTPGPPGGGDMFKATYDPEDVGDDAFDRGNHHGSQAISTVTGLQTALDSKEPDLPDTPAAPTTKFLRGDRTWAVPPDTGGGGGSDFFYYPETYGAAGNGTTDDTAALQSAYDAAAAAGGGTVVISQRYKWLGDLYLRGGVATLQLATPQIDDPLEAELGLVAGNAAARVRWGQLNDGSGSSNDNPGTITNLLVDGNNIGGTTELFRAEGANSTAYNLSIKRSINDGVHLASSQNLVFFNLQISECFAGDALILKPYQATAQGPGGNKFFGGHIGDSDVCLRVTNFGATDFFPPHDNVFDGVIFETGRVVGHDVTASVILESGETFFRSCVFTIGANVGTITEDCNVLVSNDIYTNYSTVATFDSCYFGGGAGAEKATHHVRVKQAATFNEVRMYGRTSAANATAVICTDGGDAIGGIEGPVAYITGGYTAGGFATINGGGIAGLMTRRQTPMRFEQAAGMGAPFQTRRFGEAFNRFGIDRDGNQRWTDPTTGATIAAILTGVGGNSFIGPTLIEPPRFTTALRPSAVTYGEGRMIWDTDLDTPLWSNGTAWVAPAGGGGTPGAPGAPGAVGPPGPLGNSVSATIGSISYPMDPDNATDYSLTMIGNPTLSATGMTNGQSMSVNLIQDGVGGRVPVLDASWQGVEDIVLSTTANTYDKIILTKDDLGIIVKHAFGGDIPPAYWSPNSLTGQVLWIKGDALQVEDNDDVSALDNPWGSDLSTLVGVPAKAKVLNGHKYVAFAGATSIEGALGATTSQPVLVAALVRVNHTGAGSIFDGTAGATNNVDLATNASDNYIYSGVTATTLPASGDFEVVIAVTNGASSKLRVDETEQTGTAVGGRNLTGLRIARNDAGGNYGTIDLAELIIVSNVTDLAAIEDYLIAKRDELNGV